MKLTDIASIPEWISFEQSLFDEFGLNCTVYDTTGHRITGRQYWCNNICPKIQADKEAQTTICAGGNQYLMAEAEKTGSSVFDECDAGLIKIVVPIFLNDAFIGAAGGCGLLSETGGVESFLIHKIMDLSEDEIDELCDGIKTMNDEQAKQVEASIRKGLKKILNKTDF